MPTLCPALAELPNRRLFLAIFLFCCFLMSFGFYLQYHLGLEPCPLCMTQRIFIVLSGLLALLASVHNPATRGTSIYAGATAMAAIAGGSFSGRQIYLQGLPADQVPACGPGLSYMLEVFPWTQTLAAMLKGDGNCAEVVWSFLGLSIPEWTLIAFAGIAGAAIFVLLRNRCGQTT
jgi:disulfide bond formation protein DsbB